MKIKYLLSTILFFLATVSFAQSPTENTEKYFNSIQTNHHKLAEFLQALPKGGDLHNHESGASYAENLIKYAYSDNLCIDTATLVVSKNKGCSTEELLNNAVKDVVLYDKIIDAWSMRHFTHGKESGHDHFFSTFSKFSLITKRHSGEMLAEIVARAGAENTAYLELMVTADKNKSGLLGKKLGWNSDFNKMREKLLAADFDIIIKSISTSLEQDEVKMRSILACDANQTNPGCNVKVRYLYQVLREQPPEMVFAQLLAGFEAASKGQHVVGINMVQPEDGKISMHDYKLHMQMVSYLHELYPNVYISLHAGELNDALVPESGLKFHIHDAVEIAKANRIGHGVDIAYEDNADAILQKMSAEHIMVEINLSSNEQILNVSGKEHPLPLYMQHDVPVSLSTDDEAISRSNLSKEYQYAVNTFHFNYTTLKTFSRNSAAYSFLPGKSLWKDYAYQQVTLECAHDILGSENISSSCKAFLDANEKAKLQWNLETRFASFESKY